MILSSRAALLTLLDTPLSPGYSFELGHQFINDWSSNSSSPNRNQCTPSMLAQPNSTVAINQTPNLIVYFSWVDLVTNLPFHDV